MGLMWGGALLAISFWLLAFGFWLFAFGGFSRPHNCTSSLRVPSKRDPLPGAAGPPDTVRAERSAADFTSARSAGFHSAESDGLYRLLVDSVRDYAIFALDCAGNILSWNEGASRIKGYSADEIIGKHFSIFYPADKVAERFPEHELEVAASAGRFEDEGWRLRKDGSRIWANVVITALRNDDGALVGFAKVTRDLTDRRRAEEELSESELRFRLLVADVRDYAIFMLDPEGRVASWNAGAERISGYSAVEIVDRHFSLFYPPERVAEKFPQYELEMAARHGRFEDENWRVRKDGTRFWANVVLTAMRDPGGALLGFAKITRDLTERRRAEEQRLEDARRIAAAEATSRAKSEFLTAMSHELRTPLNAIGGYADLMGEGLYGPLTPGQRDALDRLRRSQRHLLAIIEDLLSYGQIEAGAARFDIAAVPVMELLNDVQAMMEPAALRRQIRLDCVACPETVMAHADRARTRQVLVNLMANAVKFTPIGGTVTVSCAHDGDRVRVSVVDTGPGIPENHHEAIFEPFVQVGRSLNRPKEGTGLGLAISREIARGMGGTITVESQPDRGATFTLELPAA
jgi:PAS domain S-box-containing protein